MLPYGSQGLFGGLGMKLSSITMITKIESSNRQLAAARQQGTTGTPIISIKKIRTGFSASGFITLHSN